MKTLRRVEAGALLHAIPQENPYKSPGTNGVKGLIQVQAIQNSLVDGGPQ